VDNVNARNSKQKDVGRKPMKLHGYFRSSVSCTRRVGVDLTAYPHLLEAEAEAAAQSLKAFADAAPDRQPDAE
jgi:hypothetical protein